MVVLSLVGWWISHHLTALHVQDTPPPGAFAEMCAPGDGSTYDCKVVVKTKWAVLPPFEPDPVTGKHDDAATPVALLGWWYFTGVGLWYLLIGRCDHARRGWHLLLLIAVACSCAVSAFYMYILLFGDMPAKCLWCMISHGVNFLLLIGTVLLFPRRPSGAPVDAESAGDGGARAAPDVERAAHPSGRLVFATVIALFALMSWETTLVNSSKYAIKARQNELLAKQNEMLLHEFYRDDEELWARYERQEPVQIALRPDDPARGSGELLLPMVVFSDFQCPACRDFADKLEKNLVADFGGLLRVHWKHLPWGQACNEYSPKDMHPQACEAAAAAEAARVLGGNDAFWAAHDYIFAKQRNLPRMDYRALAAELGLDPERFIEAMASDAVQQRIKEDIAQAKALGVKATPMVYLWGRKVDRHMLMNPAFVRRINERFQQVRAQKLAQQKWQGLSPEERAELVRRAEQRMHEEQIKDPDAKEAPNGAGHTHDHDDGHDHNGHNHGPATEPSP
jgi:predicted DsbA family dithiol-disulfide isomerase/uncharacterized membrane protein